ncbi:hypothetical protein ED769_14890 [Escherichia coli]|nr:hypothetical protein [Escherichia coli]
MKFKIQFVETGSNGEHITDTVEAVDNNAAIATFVKRHYGNNAFFKFNVELSTGTRVYGQVFKRLGKTGGAYSLTNNCYIDADECE